MRTLASSLMLAALLAACAGGPEPDMPPLAGSAWRLVSIDDKPTLAGYQITTTFTADQVSGHTGINRFHGEWSWTDSSFHAGPFAMTRAAGPPEAMAQERAFLAALEHAARVEVSRDELVMGSADGGVLIFAPNR